jgi:hypothetical protein
VSGANDKRQTGGPAGSSVVVGVRRVAVFPAENLRGPYRWTVVMEDGHGTWCTQRLVWPKPEVGQVMSP